MDQKMRERILALFREVRRDREYAALSEEETQVQTLKEKQKMIMDICEKIMKDYMIS